MSASSIPHLERPAFVQGQRLLPADMDALFSFQRQVRWLHNRALHDWGIGLGFTVHGDKGDRDVTVEPGYAIDCAGRDILLAEGVTLQVPAVAGVPAGGPRRYLLTASWLADDELALGESRRGVCEGGGAVRRVEAPLIRWQDPSDVSVPAARFRPGLDLVLAAVQVEDCRLAATPDGALRRAAGPEPVPVVYAGFTTPATTHWSFYPAGGPRQGLQTFVDTSAAGFRRTPAYLAHVDGSRILQSAGAAAGVVIDGFAAVADPAPDGFILRLTLPTNLHVPQHIVNPPAVFGGDTPERVRTQLGWRVVWVGIEA